MEDNLTNIAFKPWESLSEEDKASFILRYRGPRQTEDSIAIPFTVLYLFLFLVGIPGNILTIAIILRKKHMRTASNFFLLNLAVTDLIALVIGQYITINFYIITFLNIFFL